MRFALRPQDTNTAPQPNAEPVKAAAAASPQNPGHTTEDARDSLREWRQRWRQIMKEAVIYFDDIPQVQVDRFRSYLRVLGTHIQPFFDQKVTHVISDNSRSEVASKARDGHRKVYTVEKLSRFLGSLLGHSLTTALDASQSARLARMLEEDTKMSANAASNSRKDDFHHFKGPYVLVYDPSTYNRPMCIKEWKLVASSDEGDWPQIRRAPMGMSPFTARSTIKSEKRKYQQHHQQMHMIAQHAEQREQHEQRNLQQMNEINNEPHQHDTQGRDAIYNEAAEHNEESDVEAPVAQAAEPSAKRRLLVHRDNDDEQDKENMIPLQQQQQQLSSRRAPPARTTNSVRLREFGEIVASGVPRYSQTSANPFSAQRETVGSKEMINLRRKVMPRLTTGHDSTTSTTPTTVASATASAAVDGTIASKAAAAAAATSGANPIDNVTTVSRNLSVKSTQNRPQAVPKPKAKKPGYCENCLEKYEDLAEHLTSKRHRLFALSEQKFVELDKVIGMLQRPPHSSGATDTNGEACM